MKLNTISLETLLSNVKMTLRSFDEAGLLDDSELMRHSEWVTNRLGMGMLEESRLVLDVDNFKTAVPFNLKFLDFLYRCNVTKGDTTQVRYFFGNPHTYIVKDYTKHICYNKCDFVEEHDQITRTISIEGEQHKHTYKDMELLKASPAVRKDRCTPSCINLKCDSPNYFNMDDNFFYFNFEKGSVYIRYHGTRLDDDGYPLIIDDPYITKAIEDYLIYKALQTIYYNSEVDVVQRLGLAKKEHDFSLKEALFNEKLPSYKRFLKFTDLSKKSYDIFKLPSITDANRK